MMEPWPVRRLSTTPWAARRRSAASCPASTRRSPRTTCYSRCIRRRIGSTGGHPSGGIRMAGWTIVRRSADLQADRSGESTWWHDAVFYQVYVRSFADSNSDGVGDLEGARTRLGYLELLGVDAVQ